MNKNIKIITTSDGSHSLHSTEINESYHSKHGAIQEAKHVFIKNGLAYFNQNKLSVLEIGFGSGLNAILTANFAAKNKINTFYQTLETVPLPYSLIQNMNYIKELNLTDNIFKTLHNCTWEEKNKITNYFTLEKNEIKVQKFKPKTKFDIVFYDAFSPTSQPHIWEISIFKKLYSLINKNGILVTYCAKGQLKRDLKSCGFKVESLPGPPGKREMVRAIKI